MPPRAARRSSSRPATTPVPRPVSRPPAHPRRGHPGAPRPVRPADDRLGRRPAAVRAGRPLRRRGREAPRPGPRRGDGALPAAPHRRSGCALGLPLEPPAEGLDAVRFVLRRLAATLADQLQRPGPGGRARAARRHPRPRLRPPRDPADPPTSSSASRSPPRDAEAIERLLVRPPREGAAAGRRRAPRAGAREGGGGDRAAAPAVHARRPRATPGSPGSSRGSRSRSGPTASTGSSSPIPRRPIARGALALGAGRGRAVTVE